MNTKNNGLKIMQTVFGKELVDQIQAKINNISPPFATFLTESFEEIYNQQELSLRDKELIVITSLITQKDTKPQLKLHLKAALKAGLSKEEILATILHLVIYIGFPATINALNIVEETFNELEIEKS